MPDPRRDQSQILNLLLGKPSVRHQRKQAAFATLLAGCLSVSLSACRNSKPSPTDVLAEVGGEKITRQDFENFSIYHLSDLSKEAIDSRVNSQLLDEYIKLRAVLLEARRQGITLSEEETRVGLGNQEREEAMRKLRGNTASAPDPKVAETKDSLLANKFYRQVVLPKLQVAPEEIEAYLSQNANRLGSGGGYYLREIRVDTRQEAEEIHRQLTVEHKDFVVLARTKSETFSPSRDGLAFYQKGELPEVIEQAVSRLKAGAISPIVQSSYGLHIFKLERRGEEQNGEEAKNALEEELLSSKQRELIKQEVDRIVAGVAVRVYYPRLRFDYVGAFQNAKK